MNDLRVGVIGGSQGVGSWFVNFFLANGYKTKFSSLDSKSEFKNNIDLVTHSDIILLAVPIPSMASTLEEIYPHLNRKILIEVCSVKKFIIDKYNSLKNLFPEVKIEFYSIHPMFNQMLKSLKGQVVIFNYRDNSNGFENELKEIFLKEKAKLYELEYLHHDKVMGVVQGLNHFNVFVSAKTFTDLSSDIGKIKDFSSPPYRIFLIFFTRYVLQDPQLYADIQMYNESVPEVLKMFKQEVDTLYNLIIEKDRDGFINYVKKARGYFEENKEDIAISNHLIEQLGSYISSK